MITILKEKQKNNKLFTVVLDTVKRLILDNKKEWAGSEFSISVWNSSLNKPVKTFCKILIPDKVSSIDPNRVEVAHSLITESLQGADKFATEQADLLRS